MRAKSVILLAEDEPNDAFFVRWGFEKACPGSRISHVHDGQEALDYLSGNAQFSDRARFPQPDLVLLDLKMPRLTGFEVLEWLKSRPEYKAVPVVVFSSSDHPADVDRAKKLGAQDYFIKPNEIDKFVQLARDLTDSWLGSGHRVAGPACDRSQGLHARESDRTDSGMATATKSRIS